MKQKIVITGANGLLGQKLVKLFLQNGVDFIATSKGANRNENCPSERFVPLDVTNEQEVNEVLMEVRPTAIIHTAAMTNVDQCESDHDGCDRLNVDAVEFLWNAAKKMNCHFQLLSTDFIFDGEKGNYSEEDPANPVSYYGVSKLKAEQILIDDSSSDNWSIVRTILVYGTGSNLSRSNLVLWAMAALPKGGEMNIVNDQFRALTWADDLAQGCWLIVLKGQKGIFHISGKDTMSVFDWVKRIAGHFDWADTNVHPISSLGLNQPAKRPPKTGFSIQKAQNLLGYTPESFEKTLDLLKEELS